MARASYEQLRVKALELSEPERAELAHELVASLDGEPETGVEQAWEAEILRRLDELDRGTAQVLNREEFKRRIRQHLKPGYWPRRGLS